MGHPAISYRLPRGLGDLYLLLPLQWLGARETVRSGTRKINGHALFRPLISRDLGAALEVKVGSQA